MSLLVGGCPVVDIRVGACQATVRYVGTCPVWSALEPAFWANSYDPSTYEMLGVKTGVGALVEARAYQIEVPDYQGVYVAVPGGQPAWTGARWDGGVAYADNGSGVLLDPLPRLVYAPQETNYITYARDFNNWRQATHPIDVTNEVGIDGTSGPIRAADVSVSNLEISYLYADVSGYTGDVSLVSWVKKETLSGAFSALRFTFSAVNDLSIGTAPRVVILLDQASGLYQVNASGYPVDGLVVDMIDEGDFWRVVATAPNTSNFQYCGYAVYPGFNGAWGSVSSDPTAVGSIVMDGFMVLRCSHEHAKTVLPIYTSGAPATRDACALAYDTANHDDTAGTYLIEIEHGADGQMLLSEFLRIIAVSMRLTDGANIADVASTAGPHKVGITYGDGIMQLTVDGVKSGAQAYNGSLLVGALDLFRGSPDVGYTGEIKRYAASDESIVDAWMVE